MRRLSTAAANIGSCLGRKNPGRNLLRIYSPETYPIFESDQWPAMRHLIRKPLLYPLSYGTYLSSSIGKFPAHRRRALQRAANAAGSPRYRPWWRGRGQAVGSGVAAREQGIGLSAATEASGISVVFGHGYGRTTFIDWTSHLFVPSGVGQSWTNSRARKTATQMAPQVGIGCGLASEQCFSAKDGSGALVSDTD